MDSTLPVRRMVLYKHGVGFVERKGTMEGSKEFKMSFKKEMMNDLLKSLLVFTSGEGTISGVSYETPEDISKMIEEKAIRVPECEALVGLFRQLKGYTVEIETNTNKVKGKVLGTQEETHGEQQMNINLAQKDNENRVVIKTEGGPIISIEVSKIVNFSIVDKEALDDLNFFLDAVTSERKKNVKAVTIFLDGKKCDLSVSYIMQMPSWRVSYRLAYDKKEGAFLQGWGIIDNVLDEDLKDINLSLVAGKPVSFIYDIYTPPVVNRPLIREEARGVGAPIELESTKEELAVGDFLDDASGAYPEAPVPCEEPYPGDKNMGAGMLRKKAEKPMAAPAPSIAPPPPAPIRAQMAASTKVQTKTVEMGEFFKYEIEHPVTVKRGQSAMVPIIQTKIACQKEHVYNGSKMARNPLVTMKLKNDTGMTLERGPIVVLDDNTYVGEAILPFTVPLADNYIAYSVDMGVVITEKTDTKREYRSVYIQNEYLYYEQYETLIREYSIENKNKDAIALVIEHPKHSGYDLIDTPKPVEDTDSFYRFKSEVNGKTQVKFTVKEGHVITSYEYLRSMSLSSAEWYYNSKYINKKSFEFLKELVDLKGQIDELENQKDQLEDEKEKIIEEQGRIRENLGALGKTGSEEKMRNKYVATLEKQEKRLEEIEDAKKKLQSQIDALNKKIDAKMKETTTKAFAEMMKGK